MCLRKLRNALLLLVALMSIQPAFTQTYSVIFRFASGKSQGAHPDSNLIMDSGGNLYGTTTVGGTANLGTVLKLDPFGRETILHSFLGGADGAKPVAGVIRDAAGNVYGTTREGGAFSGGTVFKVDASGNESVLHSFGSGSDGKWPQAGLAFDGAGNLFGTTFMGGTWGKGTVFKLDPSGNESIVVSFAGLSAGDGASPAAGLTLGGDGLFYGTTKQGGLRWGTIFRISPDGTRGGVFFNFPGGIRYPVSNVILDTAGNVYGSTTVGGGTVYTVDANGHLKAVFQFPGGPGGANPFAGVVRSSAGDLYGVTKKGGDPNCSCGVVFKVDPSGVETVLHTFTGGDGALPLASLLLDSAGNLYGTTSQGGTNNNGVIFKITP